MRPGPKPIACLSAARPGSRRLLGRLRCVPRPIAGAEGHGLLGIAERVEQRGELVEAPRRVGMLGAEHFLVNRQRALVERPCPGKVPLGLQQVGEVVEARSRVGMLGAKHLLADRQRALKERPRPGKVPLGLQQGGEVVEARRRVGMLGAEHLLADRQRALVERPRPG